MERPEVKDVKVPQEPATCHSLTSAIKGPAKRHGSALVLSPADKQILIAEFKDGQPLQIACLAIGHDKDAVAKAIGDDPSFSAECKKAVRAGLKSLQDDLRSGSQWQRYAWLLERMHPEMFALKSDLRASPSVTVNVTVSKSDCDKLAKDFAAWIDADSVTPVSQENVNH